MPGQSCHYPLVRLQTRKSSVHVRECSALLTRLRLDGTVEGTRKASIDNCLWCCNTDSDGRVRSSGNIHLRLTKKEKKNKKKFVTSGSVKLEEKQ